MPSSASNYKGLEASLYDSLWRDDEWDDLSFYQWLLQDVSEGRLLDAACGTGRLLLPLARLGWKIEGFDASSAMLDICRAKADAEGLEIGLHNQRMESLRLPRRFDAILIPGFSFQLLTDPAKARRALKRLHSHLKKGGRIVLSVFVPWDLLEEPGEPVWRLRKDVTDPASGNRIQNQAAYRIDRQEQLLEVWNRYEVFAPDGRLRETEMRPMSVRWYFRNELLLLLELAGFRKLEAFGDFTAEPAADGHTTLTILGWK